uniref:Uncharacterized protein n=1 Tax=Rhizophora mucronata TaxID=61149 RepID=A0A2P2M9X3_RHIMU
MPNCNSLGKPISLNKPQTRRILMAISFSSLPARFLNLVVVQFNLVLLSFSDSRNFQVLPSQPCFVF